MQFSYYFALSLRFQRGEVRGEGQFQALNWGLPLTPALSPFKVEWGEGALNGPGADRAGFGSLRITITDLRRSAAFPGRTDRVREK